MAKFRFEGLLKIRETERNEKKNALLLAQSKLREAKILMESREHRVAESLEETRRLHTVQPLNPEMLRSQERFHKTLVEQLEESKRDVELRLAEMEEKRRELDEAVKEVKVLKTLKEKTEERRLEEERRRSDKELDEIATQQKMLERQKGNQRL